MSPRIVRLAFGVSLCLSLCLFLCLGAGLAHAQAEAAPVPPADPVAAVGQLRALFAGITESIEAFGAGNASLVAVGRRTAVTLFGVLLVWGIVKSWILGKGMAQLLPEFLQPLVIFGLALWAVDHLGPVVKDSVAGLAQVFAGTLSLPGAPTELDVIDRMAVAAFDVATAAPSGPGSEWGNVINAVANQTLGRLFRLLAAAVLLVSGALAAGVMLMAKVQTSLAILFAPVMIPWAMWAPSAFVFNAWLGFLVTGAMQGVMAAAVAAMSIQAIDKVVVVARAMGPSDGMSFVTCCVLLLMAVTVGFLFMKVPSLASGLVGGASLNLDRWSAVGHATGNGLATAGAGAGTVMKEAYKFGRGAVEGFGRLGRGGGGAAGAGGECRWWRCGWPHIGTGPGWLGHLGRRRVDPHVPPHARDGRRARARRRHGRRCRSPCDAGWFTQAVSGISRHGRHVQRAGGWGPGLGQATAPAVPAQTGHTARQPSEGGGIMNAGLWRDAVEIVRHFVWSRRLLRWFIVGRIDETTLRVGLQAVEDRVAVLRLRHTLLDLLVTLLGQPLPLQRPVAWLLGLAVVSMLVRCARAG